MFLLRTAAKADAVRRRKITGCFLLRVPLRLHDYVGQRRAVQLQCENNLLWLNESKQYPLSSMNMFE
jgi:hypothetical protein